MSCKSSNNKIAECSINGKTVTITGVKKGDVTITVTSAATTNYNEASKKYSASVSHRYDWYWAFRGYGSANYCKAHCPSDCAGEGKPSWCCSPNELWPYSECSDWNATYGVGENCHCGN